MSTTTATSLIDLFEAQKAYAPQMARTDARTRRAKLKRMEDAIMKYREEINEAMWADFQKPAAEVELTEVFPALTELRFARKRVGKWMRPKRVPTPMAFFGARSSVRYEARGVCLIMTAWNYPFQFIFSTLAPAIAAGNTCILKPSEYTPHTNAIANKIIGECFDPQEVVMVEGAVDTATELLAMKFDHMFFIGSPTVGKVVMEAAAKNLSSVTLELGGKSPTIVDETANLDAIVNRLAWAKFMNGGQTCVAPDYILLHESQQDAFIQKMKAQLEEYYGENAQESDSLARMIHQRHADRLKDYLTSTIAQGGEVVHGGRIAENEPYVEPTLVLNAPLDSDLMQHEIFGPILPIQTYKTREEAIEIINAREKPLSLYVYSRSQANIKYFLDHTSAGSTAINMSAIQYSNPHLPFGGVNNSGLGKAHGHHGFLEFSNQRSVLDQKIKSGLELMMPPYNDTKRKLIDLTIKWL